MTQTRVRNVVAAAGSDPHCVCLDGSRIEAYHDGVMRLFEDPEYDVCVNIGIENTYITAAAVMHKETVLANVHFDIDNDRQLHANHLNMVREDDASEEDEEPKVHCVAVGPYNICIEAMYRCVNVTNEHWRPLETHTLGGLLSGEVFEPTSLLDATQGRLRDVVVNEWCMHALSCDAHFPHTVSFFGTSVIPGPDCDHTLFSLEEVRVSAGMDHFSRLDHMDVRCDGEIVFRTRWTRYASCMSPDQNNAPLTMMHVNDDEVPMRTHGMSTTDATRSVEHRVELKEGGTLLIRTQANGSASFAVKQIPPHRMDHAIGLLMERGTGTPTQAGSVTTATSSTYESFLAPHLAWKRGQSASKRKWR